MKFSGFMNVYLTDDLTWIYQFGDKTLKETTLNELKVLVNLYSLKWKVLDKKLALKSLKIDENNKTGFLNVYFWNDYWHYRGSDLKSKSLQTLKKNVLKNNLKWEETDKQLAYKTWKLDLRKYNNG